MIQTMAMLGSTALLTWLIGRRVLHLSLRDLRYVGQDRPGRGLLLGLLAGAVTAATALAIGVVGGTAEWVGDAGTLGDYLAKAGMTLGILAPAALAEEALFRGVPLVLMASALGRGTAVTAVALLFALVHIPNENSTALGIGNIALAGIFLGLAFYAPGGIWTAFGAHLGWNVLLALLDTPVSGTPFRIPLLDYHAGVPAWLTGGAFGPEGGLAATLALTAAILVTRRMAAKGLS